MRRRSGKRRYRHRAAPRRTPRPSAGWRPCPSAHRNGRTPCPGWRPCPEFRASSWLTSSADRRGFPEILFEIALLVDRLDAEHHPHLASYLDILGGAVGELRHKAPTALEVDG